MKRIRSLLIIIVSLFVLSLYGCSIFRETSENTTNNKPSLTTSKRITTKEKENTLPKTTVTTNKVNTTNKTNNTSKVDTTKQVVSKTTGEVINLEYKLEDGCGDYGYKSLDSFEKSEVMKSLYMEMKKAAIELLYSSKDYDSNIIKEIEYDSSLSFEEASTVWSLLLLDSPSFYFASSNISSLGHTLSFKMEDLFRSKENRSIINNTIIDFVKGISSHIYQNMSDLEKVKLFNDYIAYYLTYAYEEDGVTPKSDSWAHSMVSLYYHQGVCEAYAKTFMFLCNLYGIKNILVTGNAGEAHAWNYVLIDSEWYMIDVTWADQVDRITYDYFGLNEEDSKKSRTANKETMGTSYLYALPSLAQKSMNIVKLYEDNNDLGTFKDINEALGYMSTTKDYIIEFSSYSAFGALVSSSSVINHVIDLDSVKAKSITIDADYVDLGGSYIPKSLEIAKDINIDADLTITNLEINGSKINVLGHNLTLNGRYIKLNTDIIGDEGSNLIVDVSNYMNLNSNVNVDNITKEKAGVLQVYGTLEANNSYISYYRICGGTVIIDTFNVINFEGYKQVEVQDNSQLTLNNISLNGESNYNIVVSIKDETKYPDIYLDKFDTFGKIYLSIITKYTEIVDGEEIEKTINRNSITKPVLNLESSIAFSRVHIFENSSEVTSDYKIKDGQVILR